MCVWCPQFFWDFWPAPSPCPHSSVFPQPPSPLGHHYFPSAFTVRNIILLHPKIWCPNLPYPCPLSSPFWVPPSPLPVRTSYVQGPLGFHEQFAKLIRAGSKTVNPLDPRRGNFDSLRGWVCPLTLRDSVDPESDWLIVVSALGLADLRVPRSSRSRIWLVDSGPRSLIGWFEGVKNCKSKSRLSNCILSSTTGKILTVGQGINSLRAGLPYLNTMVAWFFQATVSC